MAETAQKLSLDQALALALEAQRAGALNDARAIYEQVLARVPHQTRALSMLASICYQSGEDVQADAYLDRCIEVLQDQAADGKGDASVLAALINLLLARRRNVEAERLVEQLDLPVNPIRATPEQFAFRQETARAKGLGGMIINTMPKSASESIWNKLAEGLGMAQCHLSIGLFPECCVIPARIAKVAAGGIIAKEHIPANAHNLRVMERHGTTRMIVHLRDPRQATLSWAHFVREDVSRRLMGPIWRRTVPPAAALNAELPETLDWCIEHYLPILVDFIEGWARLHDDPGSPVEVDFLTFEQFRTDPESYFQRALDFYGVERSRFHAEAEAETVHLRKGALDEWREVFSGAQRQAAWAKIPGKLAERFEWDS